MAILVAVVLCLVVGFLLYLPFLLWFRRRRRRGESIGSELRYTRSGYLFSIAMLATLFGGLGLRSLAPDSWFASWIPGNLGAIRWGIGVFLVFSLGEMMLGRADVKLRQAAPAVDAPAKPVARLWKAFTIRGVPVFVRGSLPTGGLLVACFAGSGFAEGLAYCVAFIALVFIHELGHFVAARALGLKVFAIFITGIGGSCLTQLTRDVRDTFIVFAGGLAAQLMLLLFTLAAVAIFGEPQSLAGHAVVVTFTVVNVVVAVMNLVPGKIRGDLSNDGAILWDLVRHVTAGKPHPLADRLAASVVFPPETRLTTVEGMVPPDFEVGVEMLNDDRTPMEFVVEMLERHLGLDRDSATAAMLSIHERGGRLFPLPDEARAEEVSRKVMQEARDRGHPLMCRAARAAP